MTTSTLVEQRLHASGPKKILTCDGGGILGLISVEILARLESQLRAQSGKPGLVLADYFDFVCGTSTGAIIATCISAGMPMDAIRQFYIDSGAEMFTKAGWYKRLKYKFEDEPLAHKLKTELNRVLGHPPLDAPASLGDPALRTLLMMVMRNHSTDSPWPVSNNPLAKYNQPDRPDCNLKLPLWQLVRASTAAPTYFPPETVVLAQGTPHEYQFVFVDGGVTTYNNPAFLAFQMATAAPYKVQWPTGADKLLIVSVGTGSASKERLAMKGDDLWLGDHAVSMPGALMNAAAAGWDMACRTLGECRFGGQIDREFGNMVAAEGEPSNWSGGPKQFAYVRYDPDVSQAGIDALDLKQIKAADVQLMDSVEHMAQIRQVGEAYAARHVSLAHLKGFAA
jgi:predicted acylesterase/phospholipase RssA